MGLIYTTGTNDHKASAALAGADDSHGQCPLCMTRGASLFHSDRKREYYRCAACALVFVPRAWHLPPGEEKRRYDHHRNDPADPAYRRFLARLVDPLAARLRPGMRGIDFGCGPGPAVSRMMGEQGFPMADYDIFYAPHAALLEQRYDFLTCTEAVEHFAAPRREWTRFMSLVKEGGWLGIMTQMLTRGVDFGSWYYKNDDTHVCFYSRETFRFLARRHGLAPTFIGDSVILLQRRG